MTATIHFLHPRGGDPNPAYVRLWMSEHRSHTIECEIVQVSR
jgi:hypothetical protein